jgi:magnesium and cobalt transporter
VKRGLFSRLMGEDETEEPKKGDEAARGGPEAQAERREMIKGVQELSQTTVREVMLPRIDALFFPLDMNRDELLETVSSCGHSRIPVYRDNVDNVVGVLYAKDLLRVLVKGGDFELADLVRKPFFVPETKRIDSLLREFKRRRVHMAIVVDEYGGVSGIVCLEDIIEEIVGEIQDEFDNEKEDIIPLSDGIWICDARADLDDLNEELGLSLPSESFETLGGYLFDLFGRIPVRTEKIEKDGIRFTVQDMDGNRIISVKVQRLSLEEEQK